jgi:hypothetical protein
MRSLSHIGVIRANDPTSYKDKIFLTLDVDWAHDDVLSDSIDLIEQADAPATWYITHDTPILSRLRKNTKFQLGIHPNFNFLLENDTRNGKNAEEVIDRLMDIVPEAKTVRSHSLTQSERLLDLFAKKGLTHIGNAYIPASAAMHVVPWQLWSGLVIVPHCFQDNADLRCQQHRLNLDNDGLLVFNFHPIHIFLNTENIDRYESTRLLHRQAAELIQYRSTDRLGARSLFKKILQISQ